MLTEDFLTVVSAVDEDLMIKLVRAQTRDGGTVIDFLDAVMHGREDGFKVNHRIAAGRELISHILRDEHVIARTVLEVVADPRVRPLPAPSPSTGKARGEGDSSPSLVEPAPYSIRGAGFKPALPGAAWEPCNPESVVPTYPVVVPAKAEPTEGYSIRGTQRGGEGRRSQPSLVHPEPVLSAAEEPRIVRPELVEEPAPYSIRGQCSGDSAIPGPAANGALSADEEPVPTTTEESRIVRPELVEGQCSGGTEPVPNTANTSNPETRPRRGTRTQRRRAGNAGAAMRGKPLGSGRSPPW